MVIGLKHGQAREDDKAAKEAAYRLSHEAMDRFQAEFGSCLCRELLPGLDLSTDAGHQRYKAEGWSEKVCRPCVRFAVRVLEEILGHRSCGRSPRNSHAKKGGDAGPRLFY